MKEYNKEELQTVFGKAGFLAPIQTQKVAYSSGIDFVDELFELKKLTGKEPINRKCYTKGEKTVVKGFFKVMSGRNGDRRREEAASVATSL